MPARLGKAPEELPPSRPAWPQAGDGNRAAGRPGRPTVPWIGSVRVRNMRRLWQQLRRRTACGYGPDGINRTVDQSSQRTSTWSDSRPRNQPPQRTKPL